MAAVRRQPVITGLGIVSPIGVGVDNFWSSALAGRSGISSPTLFDASKLPPDCRMVGEVRDFNPLDWMPGRIARVAGRFSQFAVAAAKMAREDSGFDVPADLTRRVSVSIGTSMNGQVDLGETSFSAFLKGCGVAPWTTNEYPAHAATSHVAIEATAHGRTTTFATACAAGLDAIGWEAEEVRRGQAVAAIAGGTETPLSPYALTLFHTVGVLSRWEGPAEEASRPYDKWRSGLVLAEGAAVVVIEEEEAARSRGAPIYARILGFGSSNEGVHLRKVDESGSAVAAAMTMALDGARITSEEIDYVCAHGNSMLDYDAAESAGIKLALGGYAWNTPASSLKSMCGQALAASSAMQVVASCLALRDQAIPPTINYRVPDPACDLDFVPNEARAGRIRKVLIHAHSLGGSHVAMVLGQPA